MKNTNMFYGVVGFLVGAVVVGGFWYLACQEVPLRVAETQGTIMHEMSDGSMMGGTSMSMEGMMQDMMAGLAGKTGDAFDKEFLAEMIVHHQGAVDMAHAVLATSKRPELLNLANDIIAAQTKEIGMMQEWQKVWFK